MNTIKKGAQRPKSAMAKKNYPPCLIPSYLGMNVWILLMEFLGINKHFGNFRLVCKDWYRYSRQYVQIEVNKKTIVAQSLKKSFEERLEASSPETKEYIERALKLKSEYEKCLELIPKKYVPFVKISDFAKLTTPPPLIRGSIMTALYLMADYKDQESVNGFLSLSWNYCQSKLKDKNLMKNLKEAPRTLTKEKIARFKERFQNPLITPERLERDSRQIFYLLGWAFKLAEYLDFVYRFDGEKREVFDLFDGSQKALEEIEKIQVMLR